jgi:hypothetical protein
MPTSAEQIATIKAQTLALIAQITADPKPSYWIDGQRVLWAEYLQQLRATVAWCDQQTAAEVPCEVQSQGFS